MVTYRWLAAPLVCDHPSHAASRGLYAEGTEFLIGRVDVLREPAAERRAA